MKDRYGTPKPPSPSQLAPKIRRTVRRQRQACEARLLRPGALSSSRLRRSQGVGIGDVWLNRPNGEAERVDDERKGRMYCRECGKEIRTVQTGHGWQARGLDGLPHILTCEAE